MTKNLFLIYVGFLCGAIAFMLTQEPKVDESKLLRENGSSVLPVGDKGQILITNGVSSISATAYVWTGR